MPVPLSTLPHLTVLDVDSSEPLIRIIVRPLEDGQITEGPGFLILSATNVAGGDFVSGAARGEYEFVFGDARQGRECRFGGIYAYLDRSSGINGDEIWLVNRNWRRDEFFPSDSVSYRYDGSGKIVEARVKPGGWNHEHCLECSATISRAANPFGYRDDLDVWLCEPCYEQRVAANEEHRLVADS